MSDASIPCTHLEHATKHFQATAHPIIRSAQPGEHWKWCYVDRIAWE